MNWKWRCPWEKHRVHDLPFSFDKCARCPCCCIICREVIHLWQIFSAQMPKVCVTHTKRWYPKTDLFLVIDVTGKQFIANHSCLHKSVLLFTVLCTSIPVWMLWKSNITNIFIDLFCLKYISCLEICFRRNMSYLTLKIIHAFDAEVWDAIFKCRVNSAFRSVSLIFSY